MHSVILVRNLTTEKVISSFSANWCTKQTSLLDPIFVQNISLLSLPLEVWSAQEKIEEQRGSSNHKAKQKSRMRYSFIV